MFVLLSGSFRGGTRGNAVPIVKKPPERMGTAFPLIVSEERMGTVLRRDKETFADQNGVHFTLTTPYAL